MNHQIRRATNQDAYNLAALAVQVFLHTYATSGVRGALSEFVWKEFTPEKMSGLLANPGHVLLIAEEDGNLLGYADLNLQATCEEVPGVTTELCTLYVQEHFLGKGIGSSLLSACAKVALEATGSSKFWLSVYHLNERALAFYQKHGLTTRGSFSFELGNERHKNLVLA